MLVLLLLAAMGELLMAGEPVINREPLAANKFYPLPLTSVKARGWLQEQLRIQAAGITGHLDEFWPDVGPNSAWLGGSGEGWAREPSFPRRNCRYK